jgi:hypothetical protein
MFGTATHILLYMGRAPLKGEGAKMVTRLTNMCRLILIKGGAN